MASYPLRGPSRSLVQRATAIPDALAPSQCDSRRLAMSPSDGEESQSRIIGHFHGPEDTMPRKSRAKPIKRKGELPAREAADAEREVTRREAEPAAERGRDVERDEPVRRSSQHPEHQE